MFLKRIHLENVRCLETAEISFDRENGKNRKWTLLVGDNGSGKSTLLKSIAIVMGGSEALLDMLRYPGSWVRNGCEKARISATVTTAKGHRRELSLTLRKNQTFRELLAENEKSLSALDSALKYTDRSYMVIGYGSTRTAGGTGTARVGDVFYHPRAQAAATLLSENARMVSFESWAVELALNPKSDGIAIVREALEGLLLDVTFKDIDMKTRQLMFNTPDGVVPLSYLSGGYRTIIGFCGDLLYRIAEVFGDYKNPLQARGVLLVDELGLHLHPKWQRVLMDFLTEKLPNLQIIATTNAPLTAHQAGEGELYYLRREGTKSPPTLNKFQGAPNKLLLHQLILSPVFGIDTANSHEVEVEQSEQKKLKSKAKKTPKDKKRLKVLEESLAEVTNWYEAGPPEQKEMMKLLEEIQVNLKSK